MHGAPYDVAVDIPGPRRDVKVDISGTPMEATADISAYIKPYSQYFNYFSTS